VWTAHERLAREHGVTDVIIDAIRNRTAPDGLMGDDAKVVRFTSELLTLQRHLSVLTKFAHVESRLSGRKRQRKVVFYAPVNLYDRRVCSASVAVGLTTHEIADDTFDAMHQM
jgi:hypothetical protein